MEQRLNWKKLLITIMIVIFIAGVVGGATWYVMREQVAQEKREADARLEIIENELRELKDQLNEDIDNEDDSREKTGADNIESLVYENSKFGFKMSYPATYRSEERYESDSMDLRVLFIPTSLNQSIGIPMNSITIYPKKNANLETWAINQYSSGQIKGIRSFNKDGLKGLYFTTEGLGGLYHNYAFEKSSRAYVISSPGEGAISHSEFVNGFSFN